MNWQATLIPLLGLAMTLGAGLPVSGALITSAPSGGATIAFPGGNPATCVTVGTLTISGFVVRAGNNPAAGAGTVCGMYSGLFGIVGNGTWSNFSMVYDNTGSTLIEIDLGGQYNSAGGFMNYIPDAPQFIAGAQNPSIAVYDISRNLLERYELASSAPISTGPNSFNAGAFRGIQRNDADIRYLVVGGSFLLLHDVTLTPAPIPEPGTFGLGAGALLGVLLLRRRR
ncbi:MAG: hypothetical protein JNK87_38425 [Bryobacterales bacterium]|nr:hypothetical protein [Bryobacterales bacterium]